MAIRGMSGLPERVIQVLKDFLPAELDLIDAEEADGITTPDIPAVNYHERFGLVPDTPACSIQPLSSRPLDVKADTFGRRIDALHRIDVIFTVSAKESSNPQNIQDLLFRYAIGAIRVLCIMKEKLETTADDNPFVTSVEWVGEAPYGPEDEQDSGAIVRSARVPIQIRRIESR